MSDTPYDLFVIGGGSGGVRAARIAAGLGARVALCEQSYYGGTCVNVGCVPKKLLLYGARYADHFEDARGFGWAIDRPPFDWATLRDNKDQEIARLGAIYRSMLERAGVEVIDGRGQLTDANTVAVGERSFAAKNILVATGSRADVEPFEGHEHTVTSDAMFHLEELPNKAVIVGGGYIGVEFASILSGLGSEVTLLHRGDFILRGFDRDLRVVLERELRARGIDVRCDTTLDHVAAGEGGLVAVTDRRDQLGADLVLVATGRRPNSAGLGLEDAGVEVDARGAIVVDREMRTSVPHIYAVGDVVNRKQLTPVALAEGMAVARRLFGDGAQVVDYDRVPTAVFSHPELGTVGMTEAEARVDHDVVIFKSEFRALKHTLSGRAEKSFMKLVVDADTDRVLGCHVVAEDAGEIVQGFAVALTCGATKAQLDHTIGIHPTAAEELVTMRTPAKD
jgi:glutathione reductase (NADPH)